MQKENYLYFSEDTSVATGEAGMWPSSSFLGVDSLTTGTTNVYFKDQTGTAAHDVITSSRYTNKSIIKTVLITW